MASTTKIMTALIALETAALDDRCVTITDEMVRVEGSSMGLQAGDQLSLTSLAAGMLVVSGNDAANSVAIAISGSKDVYKRQIRTNPPQQPDAEKSRQYEPFYQLYRSLYPALKENFYKLSKL